MYKENTWRYLPVVEKPGWLLSAFRLNLWMDMLHVWKRALSTSILKDRHEEHQILTEIPKRHNWFQRKTAVHLKKTKESLLETSVSITVFSHDYIAIGLLNFHFSVLIGLYDIFACGCNEKMEGRTRRKDTNNNWANKLRIILLILL